MSILISKILSILVPPLFVIVPLHFSWPGEGTVPDLHSIFLMLNIRQGSRKYEYQTIRSFGMTLTGFPTALVIKVDVKPFPNTMRIVR